jgi:feruloyl esterase
MMRVLLPALLALLSVSFVSAEDCAALKNARIDGGAIGAAEVVDEGNFHHPVTGAVYDRMPTFCRVRGELHPTADSDIRFEVWLPEKTWNGRYLGVGNGGFAGEIDYRALAGDVSRGFAAAATDTGHFGESEDASWAYGHREKIADFGWRAIHLTAQAAKLIIDAYYGKPASQSYFDACSDGGREALMEAQRFPEDYDGILAGAPANNWATMLSGGLAVLQQTSLDPAGLISDLKLPAIERASLAACDQFDGIKDGIVSDPEKCHFDPSVLLCKHGDNIDCLTAPQLASLRHIYAGGTTPEGKVIFPGFLPGDENGWRPWIVGSAALSSSGAQYVRNYFSYMVANDAKFNILTAPVGASLAEARAKTSHDLDATNPDLHRFAARRGKLIMYHGWNDPAISPWNSIHYYQSVQQTMGASQTASFLRLYMAPGVEHCVAGPGPDFFGQLGLATEKSHGLLDVLETWVENGTPPTGVIATKYGHDQKPAMTRPLCPYPEIAKYDGSGETNRAANFNCMEP